MKVSDGSPTCAGFSEQACLVLRVTRRAQHEARPALFRGRASRGGHALATCRRRRTGAEKMANASLSFETRWELKILYARLAFKPNDCKFEIKANLPITSGCSGPENLSVYEAIV